MCVSKLVSHELHELLFRGVINKSSNLLGHPLHRVVEKLQHVSAPKLWQSIDLASCKPSSPYFSIIFSHSYKLPTMQAIWLGALLAHPQYRCTISFILSAAYLCTTLLNTWLGVGLSSSHRSILRVISLGTLLRDERSLASTSSAS